MRQPLYLAILGASIACPALAFAYCRTTTCAQNNPPEECGSGTLVGTCQTAGQPLHWPKPCISFSVHKEGSARLGISAQQFEQVVRESFDNWQDAICPGGGRPNITVKTYPQVECDDSGYNRDGPNQNLWLFRDDSWPHEGGGENTIALTLVSFHPKTGEIYDVDVEMNSYSRNFAVDNADKGDDIYSVVQHESGHFLGLAHSDIGDSTMWPFYAGSLGMRSPESDDAAGICAVYPPTDAGNTACDAEPRHGFSTQCAEPDESCSCRIHEHRSQRGPVSVGLLLAAVGLMLLRRQVARRVVGLHTHAAVLGAGIETGTACPIAWPRCPSPQSQIETHNRSRLAVSACCAKLGTVIALQRADSCLGSDTARARLSAV